MGRVWSSAYTCEAGNKRIEKIMFIEVDDKFAIHINVTILHV